jgi:hypothetical protein
MCCQGRTHSSINSQRTALNALHQAHHCLLDKVKSSNYVHVHATRAPSSLYTCVNTKRIMCCCADL